MLNASRGRYGHHWGLRVDDLQAEISFFLIPSLVLPTELFLREAVLPRLAQLQRSGRSSLHLRVSLPRGALP